MYNKVRFTVLHILQYELDNNSLTSIVKEGQCLIPKQLHYSIIVRYSSTLICLYIAFSIQPYMLVLPKAKNVSYTSGMQSELCILNCVLFFLLILLEGVAR